MNDEIGKAGPPQNEGQAELNEDSLDSVAGGGAKDIDGVDIVIKKKPTPKTVTSGGA